MDGLLKAARRVLAADETYGLPDENTSFEGFNEWVASLFALKEVVERIDAEERRCVT